jgi:hypothetical protein
MLIVSVKGKHALESAFFVAVEIVVAMVSALYKNYINRLRNVRKSIPYCRSYTR